MLDIYTGIKDWLKQNKLTKTEYKFIQKEPLEIKNRNINKYEKLLSEYKKYLPYGHLDNYKITFGKSGTFFIDNLFQHYVDDETLVIYSSKEHPSVLKNVEKCKNSLRLDYDTEVLQLNFSRLVTSISKYKKVFVYVIGTTISAGEITPQLFYLRLKNLLEKNNISFKLIIDDVHGLFFVPRDYSIFDYVVFTSHALVRKYDMGILISKNGEFGFKDCKHGFEYLNAIKVLLKRKQKIIDLYYILLEFFKEDMLRYNFSLPINTSHHLFSIKLKNVKYNEAIHEKLRKLNIRLESSEGEIHYILIRSARFIKAPETLLEGLQYLKKVLPYLVNEI